MNTGEMSYNPHDEERAQYYSLGASDKLIQIKTVINQLEHNYATAIVNERDPELAQRMKDRMDVIEQVKNLINSVGHMKYVNLNPIT